MERTVEWTEPRTIDEAEDRRAENIGKVARIQNQLAEEAREGDGAWRAKALAALRHAQEELTRLNAWLRKAQRRARQDLHTELYQASVRVAAEMQRWRLGGAWTQDAADAASHLDRTLHACRAQESRS